MNHSWVRTPSNLRLRTFKFRSVHLRPKVAGNIFVLKSFMIFLKESIFVKGLGTYHIKQHVMSSNCWLANQRHVLSHVILEYLHYHCFCNR